jgi:hypothetical protein
MSYGFEAEKRQRFLYKESKMRSNAEGFVYKKVMGNIVYSAIPSEYKIKLNNFEDKDVVEHIGEVVNEILPFEEFDEAVKESKQFHLTYIRGYIHGGMAYYEDLISEATDETELEQAPKKTEDILGDIEYGDITDKITQKIKEEIDKDNRKLEQEENQEKNMAEDLEPEDLEEEEESFEEEEEVESDEEPKEEETPEENNEPEAEPEGEEGVEEPVEEDMVGESTFEKLASSDPFGNNINAEEDYISLIKDQVVSGYSEVEDEAASEMAKLDTIIYISIAIAFHELKIMSKREFLERIE